jgi:acetyl-CoA carboxylase biotin carboxyl carrier protein
MSVIGSDGPDVERMTASPDGEEKSSLQQCAGLDEGELHQVLDLVAGSDIVELQISYMGSQISIRREATSAITVVPGAAPEAAVEAAPPSVTPPGAAPEQPLAITSPLVGIFRSSVHVGDHVAHGQPLGAIEAMGMPTSMDAPQSGIVDKLLVQDGSPVEYGQPLLILARDEREHRL